MMRIFLLLLVGLVAACAGGASKSSAATPQIQHVVVIAMENHSIGNVIGSPDAPYMTSLAKTYGKATKYGNLTHPSLPNYMAVTGGSLANIASDCMPSSHCGSNGPSIFSEVSSWKSYEQSMPKACTKTNASPYAVKHNPAAYYRTLSSCATNDVPLPSTPSVSAKFTFITPDLLHDMHDGTVQQADAWLKSYLPKILNTSEYKAGTVAVFIWWDENGGGSNNGMLPFIVVSPRTHGVTYTTAINHYDTLFTIQSLLGVKCLASSCGQTNFASAFGL